MSLKSIFPQKLKNIYHLAQAILANFLYGFPSWNIKVIGVTGTNGKTTTCQMIAKILEEGGTPANSATAENGARKVAMSTTIDFKIGDKVWVNKTKFTTLSPFAVQKFILQAVKAGCQYLVLETSSHSLDQNRIWGVKYDTAVITNITREHLDYHKTMEEYRNAKLKLFRKKINTAVVNLDMEKAKEFILNKNYKKILFSIKYDVSSIMYRNLSDTHKDIEIVNATNIKLNPAGASYMIHDTLYTLNIPGKFNIENALAATCVGLNYGISLETSAKALEKIKGIPGRMEYIPNDKGLNIIIDYAVTPDSFEKLYGLISNLKENGSLASSASKIIAVFGSCGERDRGKRPIMGEIVARYADFIIVTNEDPYGEDPQRIIDEVFSGVVQDKISNSPNYSNSPNKIPNINSSASQSLAMAGVARPSFYEGKNCWRVLDRREAIKKALQIAKPGDYILVTGKGVEETMAVGKKRIPWNDKKVIQEELSKLS